jgi:putative hydrolase of the HAD superfamily
LLDELYAAFSRPEVWKVYPETHPTLEAIRRRGLRMAVISNWDRRLPEILDGLGLTGYFDTITVSAIEGVEKPAAAIFRNTLERLGAAPDEVIHIGDSPLEDYEGAEAAGITPVLVDRGGAFAMNGYRSVGNLAELLTLVDH